MSEQENGAATPETPVPEQPNSEVAPEGQTADQPVEGEPEPAKTYTQAELEAKIERRLARERGRTYRKIGALEARLEERETRQQAPQPEDGAPQRDQFDSYEDYLRADARFVAREETRKERQAIAQAQQQRAAQQQHEVVAEKWEEAKDTGREKYPDFDEVTQADIPITRAMATAIMESPMGHDVSYFLGKNPKEADRIGKLSFTRQVAEIAKIEVQLSANPPKTSDAPPPITQVKGREPAAKLSDRMSTDDWVKQLGKEMGWAKRT